MQGLGKPPVTPATAGPKQQAMPAKASSSSGGHNVRPDVAQTVAKLLKLPAKKVCLLLVSAGYGSELVKSSLIEKCA
jgi:hypothetical protein